MKKSLSGSLSHSGASGETLSRASLNTSHRSAAAANISTSDKSVLGASHQSGQSRTHSFLSRSLSTYRTDPFELSISDLPAFDKDTRSFVQNVVKAILAQVLKPENVKYEDGSNLSRIYKEFFTSKIPKLNIPNIDNPNELRNFFKSSSIQKENLIDRLASICFDITNQKFLKPDYKDEKNFKNISKKTLDSYLYYLCAGFSEQDTYGDISIIFKRSAQNVIGKILYDEVTESLMVRDRSVNPQDKLISAIDTVNRINVGNYLADSSRLLDSTMLDGASQFTVESRDVSETRFLEGSSVLPKIEEVSLERSRNVSRSFNEGNSSFTTDDSFLESEGETKEIGRSQTLESTLAILKTELKREIVGRKEAEEKIKELLDIVQPLLEKNQILDEQVKMLQINLEESDAKLEEVSFLEQRVKETNERVKKIVLKQKKDEEKIKEQEERLRKKEEEVRALKKELREKEAAKLKFASPLKRVGKIEKSTSLQLSSLDTIVEELRLLESGNQRITEELESTEKALQEKEAEVKNLQELLMENEQRSKENERKLKKALQEKDEEINSLSEKNALLLDDKTQAIKELKEQYERRRVIEREGYEKERKSELSKKDEQISLLSAKNELLTRHQEQRTTKLEEQHQEQIKLLQKQLEERDKEIESLKKAENKKKIETELSFASPLRRVGNIESRMSEQLAALNLMSEEVQLAQQNIRKELELANKEIAAKDEIIKSLKDGLESFIDKAMKSKTEVAYGLEEISQILEENKMKASSTDVPSRSPSPTGQERLSKAGNIKIEHK